MIENERAWADTVPSPRQGVVQPHLVVAGLCCSRVPPFWLSEDGGFGAVTVCRKGLIK
jgi:hypothetical protein